MKKFVFFFFIFFFSVQSVRAQALDCTINGTVSVNVEYSYAYLYLSNSNSILKVPVVEKKFQFIVKREKEFEAGILFLRQDSLSSKAALQLIGKGIEDSKLVAVENIGIDIYPSVKESTISGGKYNDQLTEMSDVRSRSNYKHFLEKYPDSPVSLIYLKAVYLASQRNYITRSIISAKEGFNMLSDKLKNSDEGQKLWKVINAQH